MDFIGDCALEFIVTANEHILKPHERSHLRRFALLISFTSSRMVSLEDTVKSLYNILRTVVLLALRISKEDAELTTVEVSYESIRP